jgi:3-deoxy-D-manno-octulosonate 8-phosphate phosphatase (KDO 8-P phosphatase)
MIKLLIFDVDGCMTNGKIIYDNSGKESKEFSVKDGLAISSWNRLGFKSAIITGRKSDIVVKRAKELGIHHVHQNIKNKKEMVLQILKEENLDISQVAVIGDDLNDIGMIRLVEHAFCPNDASEYIKNEARVLSKCGGDGAIREMIETIFKENNLEEEFLKLWQ